MASLVNSNTEKEFISTNTLQEKITTSQSPYEYRCKNPQENTSKLNSAAY